MSRSLLVCFMIDMRLVVWSVPVMFRFNMFCKWKVLPCFCIVFIELFRPCSSHVFVSSLSFVCVLLLYSCVRCSGHVPVVLCIGMVGIALLAVMFCPLSPYSCGRPPSLDCWLLVSGWYLLAGDSRQLAAGWWLRPGRLNGWSFLLLLHYVWQGVCNIVFAVIRIFPVIF